ncbi:uncharacterized protein METZ01_LOCUS431654, partial [marine metagenome]
NPTDPGDNTNSTNPNNTPLAATVPANLKTDLVAYYPFNGNMRDESGNDYHGDQYYSSGGFTSDRNGITDSAYIVQGTGGGGRISLPDPASGDFDMNASTSFTVGAWIKTDGYYNYAQTILQLAYRGGAQWIKLGIDKDGKPHLYLRDSNDLVDNLHSTASVTDDQWHHVMGVRDVANDKVRLYVDGVLVKEITDPTTSTFMEAAAENYIGYRSKFDSEYLYGTVDELRIYRRALNTTEIGQLRDLQGTPPSVMSFPFNGNAIELSG